MSNELIYSNQLEDEILIKILETLKQKNYFLYSEICRNFQKKSSLGIRKDVLEYFSTAECIEKMRNNAEYATQIAALTLNTEISPEWYNWINEILIRSDVSNQEISINDFMLIIDEAFNKHISLEEIKKIFSQCNDDILEIYSCLDSYEKKPEKEDLESDVENIEESIENENISQEMVEVVEKSENASYSEMFGDLINAMNIGKQVNEDFIAGYQNVINQMSMKMQISFSEYTSCITEIIHALENEQAEKERIRSLYLIQQKYIKNQQEKMNEMYNEIVRLNQKIEDAKRAEQRQVAINQKLSELQMLTSSQEENRVQHQSHYLK